MFNIIPTSLLIMALGGIVYIVSGHLSEFSAKDESIYGEDDEKGDENFQLHLKAHFIEWIHQLPLDNLKVQSLSLTQKMLHRFRLILLKTDNHLMKLIGKISEKDRQMNGNGNSGENNNGTDFWENLSKSKQENQVIEPIVREDTKIEFAIDKNNKIEKFFDIKPAKISLEISDGKLVKKILKKKKSLK